MEPTGRSPWALQGVQRAGIAPVAGRIDTSLRVPGSKSYTNRALLMAAAAGGRSVLRGFLRSDDSYWCIETLRRLGIKISVEDDTAIVEGRDGVFAASDAPLFIGSAGTTARFLPGLLAAGQGGPWVVDGSAQLRRRPLSTLVGALCALGAAVSADAASGGLPLHITGRGLRGGEVSLPGNVSSQFISGVLMACPLAQEACRILLPEPIVQAAYVEMTLDTMARFGVVCARDPELRWVHVQPQRYRAVEVDLEADASTAGYFFALAALTAGTVCVENLGTATRQPDLGLLDVLERMGCTVVRRASQVTVHGPSRLRGGFVQNMRAMSDQTMTLAVLAAFADAPVTLTHVAHIRHHESDRIAVTCANLRALGACVHEHTDGLQVVPQALHGAELPSFDDHRVAMSMALVGVRVPGVTIVDPGCVSKTCPTFFAALQRAGVEVQLS